MATSGTIPSLTLEGFINNKKMQMGKLFEYYLASDYSQSNTYYGHVSSLKYILAKNIDAQSLKKAISTDLITLYTAHYDRVDVNVEVIEPKGEAKINIHIDLVATADGVDYTLTRELVYSNGDIESFNEMLDQYYAIYKGAN